MAHHTFDNPRTEAAARLPTAKTVALLDNPANSALAEEETKEATSAAQMLEVELHVLKASTEEQLDAVFANLSQSRKAG